VSHFPVADAHVDVIMRMDLEKQPFYGDSVLQASANRLVKGGVQTQVFALYVSPELAADAQLEAVLRGVDIFYEEIHRPGQVRAVRSQLDLLQARENGELAAILSLEGGGCLHGQVRLLRVLHRLGICGVGLTWNLANELADGCREPRGGGLTGRGRAVVEEMVRLGMWIDIAHLSDAGVRDVLRLTDGRIMASHANVRSVYAHPRNLEDDVIREIVSRDGWMGLTFEASFLGHANKVTIDDVFRHVDKVLTLGGERNIGFGSDFDGTSNAVFELEHAGHYAEFSLKLAERYGGTIARRMLFENFENYLKRQLPPS